MEENFDVLHEYVQMLCDTNQFLLLPFCGTHTKPHGDRGLSKHYNMLFDPKLYNIPNTLFMC